MPYPGSSVNNSSGNSSFSKARATPSEPICTSCPRFTRLLMTGMHLAAWPRPQLSGVIKTFSLTYHYIIEINSKPSKSKVN